MKRGAFVGAIVGTLLFVLNGPVPFAQPLDYRTFFTFSGPVTIPGATLPAGQYMFRILDSSSSHNVAQVSSPDGKTTHSVFFVGRAMRPDVPDDPEVHFMETPAGTPRAIRAWWMGGDRTGWEPVYPKEQAHMLAKATHTAVLETSVNEPLASPDVAEPPLEVATADGGDAKLDAKNAPPTSGPAQKGSTSSSKAATK